MKQLYLSDHIITMEDTKTEVIGVEDGKITFLGTKEEGKRWVEDGMIFDYQDKTILPAFIDAHSHFAGVANAFLQVPLEECSNFDEILERIKRFIIGNKVPKGEWIFAKGFDPNNLEEKRPPHKDLLDTITRDNPLIITHVSSHTGIANSLALKYFGIDENTPDPEGGHIDKKEGKLTGYLEENAYIKNVEKAPMKPLEEYFNALMKAQEKYASYGITLVQEGMMSDSLLMLYEPMLKDKKFFLDITAYLDMKNSDIIQERYHKNFNERIDHFKLGGYKIFLDGSPQAKTAYLSKPYEHSHSCGITTMKEDEVKEAVLKAKTENHQILAHCNGDEAAEMFIKACESVGTKDSDIRPVMIHSQLLRIDQMDRLRDVHIIPSFFEAHVYYWGDVHIENLGERAYHISAIHSALAKGIPSTLHTDAPVIEPNLLESISIATTRKTKKGVILGEDEIISVEDALKAITIYAAYQYHEEDLRGSIAIGKIADLVILDQNPYLTKPEEIKNISILETIKEGKSIYKKENTL